MDIQSYLYGTNEDIQRYFALLTQILQDGLGPNGFTITQLSNAVISIITAYSFNPVLPAGTQWFNTDIQKMQFISVSAIPLTLTNATVETITSA